MILDTVLQQKILSRSTLKKEAKKKKLLQRNIFLRGGLEIPRRLVFPGFLGGLMLVA